MASAQHEKNRLSWNAATVRHNLHKGDQAKFFRDGGNTLFPEEIELLGEVRGKALVHLQCNCGQDTLSIAKHLGATVTGVDISDEAISVAKRLVEESGIAALFDRSDVFDWCERLDAPEFDVAYVSYGAISWLEDIARWGQCLAKALKPGGRVVLMEFHPLLIMLDEESPTKIKYGYMGGTVFEDPDGVGDYVEISGDSFTMANDKPAELPPFENPHPVFDYEWGLGEIVTALLDVGFRLDSLREYPLQQRLQAVPRHARTPRQTHGHSGGNAYPAAYVFAGGNEGVEQMSCACAPRAHEGDGSGDLPRSLTSTHHPCRKTQPTISN